MAPDYDIGRTTNARPCDGTPFVYCRTHWGEPVVAYRQPDRAAPPPPPRPALPGKLRNAKCGKCGMKMKRCECRGER